MSSARTRSLESARRIAHLWKTIGDLGREALTRDISPAMARALDALLVAVEAPEHLTRAYPVTERGRAENGYQPETEHVWSCSCRPGASSGDLSTHAAAVAAAVQHQLDPTQFPGWLE